MPGLLFAVAGVRLFVLVRVILALPDSIHQGPARNAQSSHNTNSMASNDTYNTDNGDTNKNMKKERTPHIVATTMSSNNNNKWPITMGGFMIVLCFLFFLLVTIL